MYVRMYMNIFCIIVCW